MDKNEILKIRGSMSKVDMGGFPIAALRYAFEFMNSNTDNWKNDFYTKILSEDFDLCNAACIFMAGAPLVINSEEDDGKILNCYCAGYYNTIGA